MGPESKGRAWFGKIYNKLETLLVEVDSFTSQSSLCFEPVKGEPKDVAEGRSSVTYNLQQHHDRVASPRCESPSDPPSHQNFDIPGHVVLDKRVQGDILKESLVQEDIFTEDSSASSLSDGEILSTSPLLEEYHDANLTSATTIGDEEAIVADEESWITNSLKDLSSGASIVQQHHDPVDSPSCKSPSDPPPDQNFNISGHVPVEERVQGDIFKENLVHGDSFKENSSASSLADEEILSTSQLLEEYCDANLASDTTLGDEEPIVTDEESQITSTLTPQKFSAETSSVIPGEESVEEVRVESSLPDGEILSTSSLLEEYCDANLTSATILGDKEPIITDDQPRFTNTLTPQKFSAGNSSVFPGEESVEEVKVKSCRDVVSTESQSTQSSMESFGTVVKECNDDPVLAALGFLTDNDSSLNPLATKIPDAPVQDNVANMRSSNADNPVDVINGKFDVAPLDTNALYGIEFREDPSYVDETMCVRIFATWDTNAFCGMESREDPSYVDDSALYAIRLRTKKLRYFKRMILDAITSKRRREKEYEQLAIWFGDADMGSDLATEEDSKQVEATDSKSSQLLKSEDSHWELL